MKTSILPSSLLTALLLISAIARLGAADSPPSATTKVATPIVSSDETVQKNLANLDRLLDESLNSKLEESLRKNIEQLEAKEFLQTNPDVALLIKQQPGVVPALKVERHFLIRRYLAHRARGPLLRPDVVALDKFLVAHPDIRKALENDPSQIVESKFLIAHPAVGDFFEQHPSLSSVLLEKRPSNKK
jgi:hypothetical protein